jgi:hypothetical protein
VRSLARVRVQKCNLLSGGVLAIQHQDLQTLGATSVTVTQLCVVFVVVAERCCSASAGLRRKLCDHHTATATPERCPTYCTRFNSHFIDILSPCR